MTTLDARTGRVRGFYFSPPGLDSGRGWPENALSRAEIEVFATRYAEYAGMATPLLIDDIVRVDAGVAAHHRLSVRGTVQGVPFDRESQVMLSILPDTGSLVEAYFC
jgi:hypothetical protein